MMMRVPLLVLLIKIKIHSGAFFDLILIDHTVYQLQTSANLIFTEDRHRSDTVLLLTNDYGNIIFCMYLSHMHRIPTRI